MGSKGELVNMALWPFYYGWEVLACLKAQFSGYNEEDLLSYTPLSLSDRQSPVWSILLFAASYITTSYLANTIFKEQRSIIAAFLYTLGMISNYTPINALSNRLTGAAHHQIQSAIAGASAASILS